MNEVVVSYTAGLTAFLAPCLLPLIPAYFSALTGFTFADLYGLNFKKIRGRVFLSSVFFSVGFILIFTLLGATSTAVSQFLTKRLGIFTRIGGVLLIFLGLVQIGVIKLKILNLDFAWRAQKKLARLGFFTAFLTGVTAAIVWIPCISPVLGAILLLAGRSQTTIEGVRLLFIFSLGISTPFVILGLFFPEAFGFLQQKKKGLRFLSLLAGLVIILFGLVLTLNQYPLYLAAFQSLENQFSNPFYFF